MLSRPRELWETSHPAEPVVNVLLYLILRVSVTCLELAFELLAVTVDLSKHVTLVRPHTHVWPAANQKVGLAQWWAGHRRMGCATDIQVSLTLLESVSLKLNNTPDVGKDRSTLPSAS